MPTSASELAKSPWRSPAPGHELTWGKELTGDPFAGRTVAHHAFQARPHGDEGRAGLRPHPPKLSRAGSLPFHRWVGLDLSAENVQHLSREFTDPRIEFVEGDAESARVDTPVDTVISSLTFKHIYPSFKVALRNLAGQLYERGLVLFDLIESSRRYFHWDEITYVREYSREEVDDLLARAPLELVGFDTVAHDREHVRLLVVAAATSDRLDRDRLGNLGGMEAASRLNLPWFESPFFSRELENADLDDVMRRRVQAFADRGYVVFDRVFTDFDDLADEIDATLEDEYDAGGNRVQDASTFVPAVRKLATDPTVLADPAGALPPPPSPVPDPELPPWGRSSRLTSDLLHFNSLPPRYMPRRLDRPRGRSARSTGHSALLPGEPQAPRVFELHDLDLAGSTYSNRDEQYDYNRFVGELLHESGLEKETVSLQRGQALISRRTSCTEALPSMTLRARASLRSLTATSRTAATTRRFTPIRRSSTTRGGGWWISRPGAFSRTPTRDARCACHYAPLSATGSTACGARPRDASACGRFAAAWGAPPSPGTRSRPRRAGSSFVASLAQR